MLSDHSYNLIKKLVQIVLPALATLYFTLSTIWDLPYAEQIVGTLAAVATFLGVVLGLSKKSYDASDAKYDGDVIVTQTPLGNTRYSLELNTDPEELKNKKDISFKVMVDSEE
jgi:hypothetical protein